MGLMQIFNEELQNMERVTKGKNIDAHAEMPVVMADAIISSKEADEAVEKEMKEHRKGKEVEPNKVLGAGKQPVPKKPTYPKINLEESLFEDVSDYFDNSDCVTSVSFDFGHNGDYDQEAIEDGIGELLAGLGLEFTGYVDFEDVSGAYVESLKGKRKDKSLTEDMSTKEAACIELTRQIEQYIMDSHLTDADWVAGWLDGIIDVDPKWIEDSNGDKWYRLINDFSNNLARFYIGCIPSQATPKNESITEGRIGKTFVDSQGNKYSDEDRSTEDEDDLFTEVMEELCPTHRNFLLKSKFRGIPANKRYEYDQLSTTYDGDIQVVADSEDELDFAFKVGEKFNLPVKGPNKYKDKFSVVIKIPEE